MNAVPSKGPAKIAAPKIVGNAKAAPAKAAPANSAPAKVAAKPVLDSPAKIRPIEQAVGVTSEAVARRTGKNWAEWFALLDAAGAETMDHKGIVAVLAQ
ncbi:MAG TPA: hypothetical protein VGM29_02190, partial [Polyangiaceae bacterium]